MSEAKTMTRRQFVERVAQAGGFDAAYHTMHALGMMSESTYRPLKLQGQGNGKRVVILGAGLAGLVAAYELTKLGYSCQILEARTRPGGRCWTVRGGDSETEVTGARQVCEFDEGLFYNPGPSRIPYHHRGVLSYCKEFGVELEVVVNFNSGAYFYNENVGTLSSQAVPQRQALADMRGYAAELLAKAVGQNALDDQLSQEDRDRLIAHLKVYCDLPEDLIYKGTPRRGYRVPPGAGTQAGEIGPPHSLGVLLESGFWKYFHTLWAYNEQMVMLTPVHGMDRIAYAFADRVGRFIRYGAEVRAIRRTPSGVRIVYHDTQTQQMAEATGDYCICTIPLSVLSSIPGDYLPGMANAIKNVSYGTGVRIGLQFKRRFWEEDEAIYGGITWTSQIIQQMLYPAHGLQTQKGVLLAAYPFGTRAYHIAGMTPQQRIEATLAAGEKIHPQYRAEYENGFSVPWHLIRYNLGCYTAYSELARKTFYPILNQTDGHIFLAGEHMSYLIGWQEGSILSGMEVVEKVHEHAQANATPGAVEGRG
jgi:monoamine oxidase